MILFNTTYFSFSSRNKPPIESQFLQLTKYYKMSHKVEERCKHYSRRCFLQCPECQDFFPCHHCHNEKADHQLERSSVKRLMCSICQNKQDISKKCGNCQASFGKYSCLKCCMFDDVDKKQFHCDECGICRTGGRENFTHCKKCSLCIHISTKDQHTCEKESAKSNCPVCLENLRHSVERSTALPCQHLVHQPCDEAMKKNGHYKCSFCEMSKGSMAYIWEQLDREIQLNPMPEKYHDIFVSVTCNDCEDKSSVKFHFLGMKCEKCKSYNTQCDEIVVDFD